MVEYPNRSAKELEEEAQSSPTLLIDSTTFLQEIERPYSQGKKKIVLRKFEPMQALKVSKEGEIKEASKHQCQLEFYTLAEDRSCYYLDQTLPFDVLKTSKLYQAFWCRNEVFFFSQ